MFLMLRFLTAGETHGKCLVAILEGMCSNLAIDEKKINEYLCLRQGGYGRGGRMKIETDTVEILSGVRGGKTLGSPIALLIKNKDFENWKNIMGTDFATDERKVTTPRPGHADLTGAIKYGHGDIRNVLERASARETAIRTAVGAVCAELLEALGIKIYSRVVAVGNVKDETGYEKEDFEKRISASEMRMYDKDAEEKAKKLIDEAKQKGESLGGVIEVIVKNVPAGLGSYVSYDRKADAALCGAMMSIQAIKAAEIGDGICNAYRFGSDVHDEITLENGKYKRRTNRAGGIEGGMTNGEDIVIRAYMKPIPTLYTPLDTVDFLTGEPKKATVERSDICAVSAASVVCLAAAAFEIAKMILDKYDSDDFNVLKKNFDK